MLGENTNYGTTSWPPQYKQTKKPNKYSKPILLLTVTTIIFVIAYCYMHGVYISDSIRSFISGSNSDTDEEIIIEYNYDDLMVFKEEISMANIDDTDLSFGSLLWMDFHHTLISENGYDSDKFSDYTFKISDDGKKGGKATTPAPTTKSKKGAAPAPTTKSKKGPAPTAKPTTSKPTVSPTPKPTPLASVISPSDINGGFECFTKYSYGSIKQTEFFLTLDCYDVDEKRSKPAAAQMTGCISYTGRNKYRAGELIQNGTADKCIAWSDGERSTQPIGIGVRCCKSVDKTQGFAVSPKSEVGEPGKYCVKANCEDNGLELGCAGNYGVENALNLWSSATMGVKHTKNGECQMARRDLIADGTTTYLEIQPLCGSVNHGTIECYDVTGTKPPNVELKTYYSFAICGDGYSLIDCNSYIEKGIGQCYAGGENYGVTYGGYFDTLGFDAMGGVQCVAEGTWMNIRAQARCCKLA